MSNIHVSPEFKLDNLLAIVEESHPHLVKAFWQFVKNNEVLDVALYLSIADDCEDSHNTLYNAAKAFLPQFISEEDMAEVAHRHHLYMLSCEVRQADMMNDGLDQEQWWLLQERMDNASILDEKMQLYYNEI